MGLDVYRVTLPFSTLTRLGKRNDVNRLSPMIPAVHLGVSGLVVEYFRLRFESHLGHLPSNLEQVANLLCAPTNSASYPQWEGK